MEKSQQYKEKIEELLRKEKRLRIIKQDAEENFLRAVIALRECRKEISQLVDD